MAGGGANDVDGAGGYSGGTDEASKPWSYNGEGGASSSARSGGGGYYTSGKGPFNKEKGMGRVGGMVGAPYTGTGNWFDFPAGSGGSGGQGGTVRVSENAKIYAYNGDMITNDDYDTTHYEYDKDGNTLSTVLNVIQKNNGKKIIPAKIFAQSGIIRATYTTNQGNYNLAKVKRALAPGEKLPALATSYATVQSIRATDETTTKTTGYNTGYMSNQGIGSRSWIFRNIKRRLYNRCFFKLSIAIKNLINIKSQLKYSIAILNNIFSKFKIYIDSSNVL